jgi:hypothetical protein
MLTTFLITLAGWLFTLGASAVQKKQADDAAMQAEITAVRARFAKAQADLLALHKS